jgi:hypothetical protein
MKKYSIIIIFLTIGSVFAQEKNKNFQTKQSINVYVSPFNFVSFMKSGVLCDCGQDSKEHFVFGGFYKRKFDTHFSYEIGVEYTHHLVEFNWYPDGTTHTATDNIDFVSIPAKINYEFSDYFFVQGGLLFDYQTNETEHYRNQSGLGFEFGLGLQYEFQKFRIFAKPNYKRHALLSIYRTGNDRIVELGVQFGIGYNL